MGWAAVIGTALAILFFYIKRRAAKADDPLNTKKHRDEAIAREILRHDQRAANRSLDDDLRRLRALQSAQRRQGSDPGEGGPKPEGPR